MDEQKAVEMIEREMDLCKMFYNMMNKNDERGVAKIMGMITMLNVLTGHHWAPDFAKCKIVLK